MRGRRAAQAVGAFVVCCMMLLAAAACSAPKNPAPARGQARIHIERAEAMTPAGFARCERRLEHSARPILVVAGASFTAGTGPGNPRVSWAVRLTDMLHWNAAIVGVPGAGYARAGAGGQGPALRLLAREKLAALHPALVILQFGHDDIGVPAATERQRVAATLGYVRTRVPRARIALITVFTPAAAGPHLAAAKRTDAAIVSAAAAFSRVVVMNPLARDWRFQRAMRGGLHPSAAGNAQIAEKVARVLDARGVLPAPAAGHGAPLICESGLAGHHVRVSGRAA